MGKVYEVQERVMKMGGWEAFLVLSVSTSPSGWAFFRLIPLFVYNYVNEIVFTSVGRRLETVDMRADVAWPESWYSLGACEVQFCLLVDDHT